MIDAIVQSTAGVTLAGGAAFSGKLLAFSQSLAPRLVAADGGADRLLRLGAVPEAVIGDLDSISAAAKARLADRLFPIGEQMTTDFDKALRSIAAPFVLGIGFLGGRLDHELAALNSLARHPHRRCILLSPRDLAFLAPQALQLRLRPGIRLSLFPLAPVRGTSQGLRWPLEGLDFAPGGMIGTSNEVSAAQVQLRFDRAAMVVILPRSAAAAALDGLLSSDAPVGS
jgi:thiamine pyrophosphokinase